MDLQENKGIKVVDCDLEKVEKGIIDYVISIDFFNVNYIIKVDIEKVDDMDVDKNIVVNINLLIY